MKGYIINNRLGEVGLSQLENVVSLINAINTMYKLNHKLCPEKAEF
tara:strand:+ start:1091 stop:1228 length:138 start_codon:yes stop_codon:yes gene_type:complete